MHKDPGKIFVRFALFVTACLMCVSGTYAQLVNSQQAIEMEADSTGADAINGTITFTKISIRQGDTKIVADAAEATELGFADSTWTFTGDVKITSPKAQLDADQLALRFKNNQIDTATVSGAPLHHQSKVANQVSVTATSASIKFLAKEVGIVSLAGTPIEISQLDQVTGKITSGRADQIKYDATTNNLQLIGNAQLGEGGNLISGNQITYNLVNQTVLAAASDQGNDRVHITILPPNAPADTDPNNKLPENNARQELPDVPPASDQTKSPESLL